MKRKLFLFFCLSAIALSCKKTSPQEPKQVKVEKPKVSFTFDDGVTHDILNFKFETWNQMILNSLEEANLQAVFFVTGKNKLDKKGQFLLNSWDAQGHIIANHTYKHPNFNAVENTASLFENELLRTDSIISKYTNYRRLFRFPYLKEGQNQAKVNSIRNALAAHNYKNGYVTIDASDWYVNSRLIQKIKDVGMDSVDFEKYEAFYITHLLERAEYYEKLSYELNDRHIPHTILLHHNLTSALFLGSLIDAFKDAGWEVINANEAFQDEIFDQIPKAKYAGESLIWSTAKQSGKYEGQLRYPAEDSRYEKPKMDELDL